MTRLGVTPALTACEQSIPGISIVTGTLSLQAPSPFQSTYGSPASQVPFLLRSVNGSFCVISVSAVGNSVL